VDIHGQRVGEAIAAAARFAKSEAGKPYIWGGVGPEGYDCSGFMSAITNVLRGENPHKRL
jgi:cell wall-associated NlpC family hydrolase